MLPQPRKRGLPLPRKRQNLKRRLCCPSCQSWTALSGLTLTPISTRSSKGYDTTTSTTFNHISHPTPCKFLNFACASSQLKQGVDKYPEFEERHLLRNGFAGCVTVCADADSLVPTTVLLSNKNIYAAYGIHPHVVLHPPPTMLFRDTHTHTYVDTTFRQRHTMIHWKKS